MEIRPYGDTTVKPQFR